MSITRIADSSAYPAKTSNEKAFDEISAKILEASSRMVVPEVHPELSDKAVRERKRREKEESRKNAPARNNKICRVCILSAESGIYKISVTTNVDRLLSDIRLGASEDITLVDAPGFYDRQDANKFVDTIIELLNVSKDCWFRVSKEEIAVALLDARTWFIERNFEASL